ncbi:M57 family metalloprotease [Bacteriovorax sp. DB6_IX]|uniref:M57 family metalloprotease n=1 Tax=Bacteriovorax sp. DB6_IX TaxID=1353530 RepID=UPI00038A1978|nr:M57 family metalloprotease [Bacteriovorax sp. DB6_IX]EQC50696.1 matrixin [Bacteriovorax sp. DB6_IX]
MKKTVFVLSLFMSLLVNAQVTVFKEPFKGGVHIVDGDIPVSDLNEIEKYLAPKNYVNKLIINVLAGNLVDSWSEAQRFNLSYCISNEFGDKKEQVIASMEEASQDWMTTGNLKFVYDPSQDEECHAGNESILFDIRPANHGGYLARAFFPSSPRSQRNLIIDQSSFTIDESALVGILRHEIGHILGFRHEHISDDNETGKCKEDRNFKPLTNYDNKSVMHYPQCGGKNDILNLVLTDTDREGVSLVYN